MKTVYCEVGADKQINSKTRTLRHVFVSWGLRQRTVPQCTAACCTDRHRDKQMQRQTDIDRPNYQGCRVLVFCGNLTPTPKLENSKPQTPMPTLELKNLDWNSDSRPKIRLRLWLYDLLCDIMIVYLRMTWEKFIQCTIVYKQSFSCKINCTKVK